MSEWLVSEPDYSDGKTVYVPMDAVLHSWMDRQLGKPDCIPPRLWRRWDKSVGCAIEVYGLAFVYYIQCGAGGPVKIGLSRRPAKRLIGLQIANPVPLTMLGLELGGSEAEAARHEQFAAEWIRGEWFRSSPRLLRHIKGLRRGWQRDIVQAFA
jgi:hypothetical protein